MSQTNTQLPIVLIPGYMLDESMWEPLIPYLEADRVPFPVSLTPGSTIEEIATRIAAEIPDRSVVVGFSLGGYIARKLAELYPERVAALVLIATSVRTESEARGKARRDAVAAMNAATFRGISPSEIAKSLHPDRRGDKALIDEIRNMGARLGYQALVEQTGLRRNDIAAATLTCPTLVIAADGDALRSAEELAELANTIPNAELKVIEQSGHMVPLEQPTVLAATIEAWLSAGSFR
jgi:pimeloyl-ACP methyl ester carboxylesterase